MKTACSLVVLCAAAPVSFGAFIPVLQSRSITATGTVVSLGGLPEVAFESATSPDFSDFDELRFVAPTRGSATAAAMAAQSSVLDSDLIQIDTIADASADATATLDTAESTALSRFEYVFRVDMDSSMFVNAGLFHAENGLLVITFARVAEGPLVTITLNPGSTPPQFYIETPPGVYSLILEAEVTATAQPTLGIQHAEGYAEFKGTFEASAALCAGDANFDFIVDFRDVTAVLAHFGTDYPLGTVWLGDADRDSDVNFEDVTEVLQHFNAGCD